MRSPAELLAACRAVLGYATERAEVAVYDRLPNRPGGTGGIIAHRLTLDADRSQVEDLVREIDQALTGCDRDFFVDRNAVWRVVLAMPQGARDEMLVDLLAKGAALAQAGAEAERG